MKAHKAQKDYFENHLWSFEADHIIENDASVIFGLEVQNGDLTCLDDALIIQVGQSMCHLIESCVEGVSLYFLNQIRSKDIYIETMDLHESFDQSDSKLFSQNKCQFINQQNLAQIKTFILLKRQSYSKSKQAYLDLYEQGKRDIQRIEHYLNNSIFQARALNQKDLYSLYFRHLNQDTKLAHNQSHQVEHLLRKDIEAARSFVRVGDQCLRTLTLQNLPEQTEPGLMMNLCNAAHLDQVFDYDVCVHMSMLEQKDIVEKLKRKSMQKSFLADLSARKNHQIEASIEDIDELLDDMAKNNTKLLNYHLSIQVSDKSIKSLNEKSDHILEMFKQLNGATGTVYEYDQLQQFLHYLPGLSQDKPAHYLLTSKNASDLVPVYQNWSGCSLPKHIIYNKNHGLLPLDLFDRSLQAYNGIIFGSTGSGKSFTANYFLQNILSQGHKVTIVDIGGSYRKLVKVFNGDYFDLNDSCSFNPFFNQDDLKIDKDFKLSIMCSIVEAMLEDNNCNSTDKAIIDQAIASMYQGEVYQPTLLHLEQSLKALIQKNIFQIQDIQSILEKLHIWMHGRYCKYFNNANDLYSNKSIVAFDLKGLDKRLQTVVVTILSGLIWNRITQSNSKQNNIILFDEVWALFKQESAANLIEELYRTARKYHAGVYAISQSIDDFSKSSVSSAILNNSLLRFCLKVQDDDAVLKNVLDLNKHEVQLLKSLRNEKGFFSELFLCFGEQNTLAKIKPSPLEYWLCTTNKKDLNQEQNLQNKHPNHSYLDILNQLAQEYPHGV